jgi:hypothetical protein
MDTPKRCSRDGCGRGVREGYRCCSYLCDTVNNRLEQVERMCRALGPVPLSVEMWTSVVALSDALTLEQKLEGKLYRLAVEQGFTAEEWTAIKGRPQGRMTG